MYAYMYLCKHKITYAKVSTFATLIHMYVNTRMSIIRFSFYILILALGLSMVIK